ncbi:hypothetical protein [Chryseobacterium wanjuense]
MKKLFHFTIIGLMAIIATACKHQAKDEITQQSVAKQSTDKITKDVYRDEFGDQLEVTVNETQNTVVVRLDGKSYELKKVKNCQNTPLQMQIINIPTSEGR